MRTLILRELKDNLTYSTKLLRIYLQHILIRKLREND